MFAVLVLLAAVVSVNDDTRPGHSSAVVTQETLTNASILEMVKLGLSPATVLLKIQSSEGRFDTSIPALGVLKANGVPDAIVEAMLAASAKPSGASVGLGLLVEVFLEAEGRRLRLNQAPSVQKMSYGLFGADLKTVIPGKSSNFGTTSVRPFLDVRFSSAGVEPRTLIVSRLGESDEGGGRQLDAEASEPFEVTSTGDGAYRIRPIKSLKRGEYVIYQTVEAQSLLGGARLRIFDFRIGPER
jgi:hypothetical protein